MIDQIAVCALVWRDRHPGGRGDDLVADSVCGQYVIRPTKTGARLRLWVPGAAYDTALHFETFYAAKAAGQADFEKRIRSAFIAPSATIVSIKPMRLGDGRCDYFVSFKHGDREVTPHVFREQFKAEYHVAEYRWLFGLGEKPDRMAFNEDDWPVREFTKEEAEAFAALRASCPPPTPEDETYYRKGKDATWFEALSDVDFAREAGDMAMDLNDTTLGDDLDRWMPFQAVISIAVDRIRRLLSKPEVIEWQGSEDQQAAARQKACDARCKKYNDYDCDRDGSCTECEHDMHEALRVPVSAGVAVNSDELRNAAIAGWNACRRQVYALSQDYIDRTHELKGPDTTEGNFHRGQYDVAKRFGKAFGAFEADDCDELNKIDFAALSPSPDAALAGQPTIFVSQEQFEARADLPSNYLPFRLAAEGKFQMPLYSSPPQLKALSNALVEAEETLRLAERPAARDSRYGDEVEALGMRVGFGVVMASASASWRQRLKSEGNPVGGEFVAGPCHGTVVATLAKIRAALASVSPVERT